MNIKTYKDLKVWQKSIEYLNKEQLKTAVDLSEEIDKMLLSIKLKLIEKADL